MKKALFTILCLFICSLTFAQTIIHSNCIDEFEPKAQELCSQKHVKTFFEIQLDSLGVFESLGDTVFLDLTFSYSADNGLDLASFDLKKSNGDFDDQMNDLINKFMDEDNLSISYYDQRTISSNDQSVLEFKNLPLQKPKEK